MGEVSGAYFCDFFGTKKTEISKYVLKIKSLEINMLISKMLKLKGEHFFYLSTLCIKKVPCPIQFLFF